MGIQISTPGLNIYSLIIPFIWHATHFSRNSRVEVFRDSVKVGLKTAA